MRILRISAVTLLLLFLFLSCRDSKDSSKNEHGVLANTSWGLDSNLSVFVRFTDSTSMIWRADTDTCRILLQYDYAVDAYLLNGLAQNRLAFSSQDTIRFIYTFEIMHDTIFFKTVPEGYIFSYERSAFDPAVWLICANSVLPKQNSLQKAAPYDMVRQKLNR